MFLSPFVDFVDTCVNNCNLGGILLSISWCCIVLYSMHFRYITVIFLQITDNRRPIPRPWAMGRLLWVESLSNSLTLVGSGFGSGIVVENPPGSIILLSRCVQCYVTLDRNISRAYKTCIVKWIRNQMRWICLSITFSVEGDVNHQKF